MPNSPELCTLLPAALLMVRESAQSRRCGSKYREAKQEERMEARRSEEVSECQEHLRNPLLSWEGACLSRTLSWPYAACHSLPVPELLRKEGVDQRAREDL